MLNWYRRLHSMLKRFKNKYAGMTLVEILIALAVNGILLAALVSVFSANINNYTKTLNTSRLIQNLQTALLIMSNDIRRAGYYANAYNDIGTGLNNNPFVSTSNGTDVSINSSNNCILFSYDHDSNGAIPAISASIDDERYGFRLLNQAIQARPPGAAFSCTAGSTAWENITDTNIIQITNLTFTLNQSTITTGPGTKGIIIRSVDITITGQLTNDSSITKTLTQHVRIINDKYIP